MFKKLKDKLEGEFKQGPLKLPVAVQQLAQVISPSPSLNSLSENAGSSTSYPSNVSTEFFSIGDDDDSQDGTSKTLPMQSIDLTATSPSNMTLSRSRRSSLSSVTSEASSLFPIYENPSGPHYFQSDLESEMEDGMPSHVEKISKEQLYQSYKKVFNRYNKYKGRYVDLLKNYKELQHDSIKTKNVLQESQDKAFRRISELKEQCQLEQNAKAHLEESLRNDVEDRDHIINTLKTKISLLKAGGSDGLLVDLNEKVDSEVSDNKSKQEELETVKLENENLKKEIEELKKLKETACHLIHRCDTTINEATEDASNENIKRKMSELRNEIQKMKSENESLSHLLSRNIMTEDDGKSPGNSSSFNNNFLIDLSSGSEYNQTDGKVDEKDRKIEKLNNLLLKCKEKINTLNTEIKSKNLIIEDRNKKLNETTVELETNKKMITHLTDEIQALKVREEENVLSVAENKMAIHKELETKEEQIKELTKELKTSENEFRKEKDELIKKYEDKIMEMTEDFTKELKNKSEQNEKLNEDLNNISNFHKDKSVEMSKEWEKELNVMLHTIRNDNSFEEYVQSKYKEIEKASSKLEEKISTFDERIMDLVRAKQREHEEDRKQMKDVIEKKDNIIAELKSSITEERDVSLKNLKTENEHFNERIEKLERENKQGKEENQILLDELDKIKLEAESVRSKNSNLESEIESLKGACTAAETENKRLKCELSDLSEKLKLADNDNCLLEKINSEKNEAERKLSEYIDDYKKLEKENQLLEKDLSEKCDKLLKDLNDSKEKIKHSENENKRLSSEIEVMKRELANASQNREQNLMEIEESKAQLQLLQEKIKETGDQFDSLSRTEKEMREQFEKLLTEYNSLKNENDKVVMRKTILEEENERLKADLAIMESKVRDADLSKIEIENNMKEKACEKDSELEIVKNELSGKINSIAILEEVLKNERKINEELRSVLEEEKTEKDKLNSKIAELKSSYDGLEQLVKELERKCEDEKLKSRELEESNVKASDSLKEENKKLVEEMEVIQASKSQLLNVIQEKSDELNKLSISITEKESDNNKLRLELEQSEKARSEAAKKMKELLNERDMISDSLQVKCNEFELLKESLNSAKDELLSKVKAFEDEKLLLTSENENKLNILKNEIKFINDKFEEDLGNMERNRNAEVNNLNSRLEVAEKTSTELLEKLERITAERDEAKTCIEERDLRITEMEGYTIKLKSELDEKFNKGQTNETELPQGPESAVPNHELETKEKDEEIRFLRSQLEEYNQLVQALSANNQRLKNSGNESSLDGTQGSELNEYGVNADLSGPQVPKEVEETAMKEIKSALNTEMEMESQPEPQSVESLQKKVTQQEAELRELRKQYKREVTELRKIITLKRKSRRNSVESPDWGGTLDNDTEHEYLRNILYEYMMGREQLVLAKVLSAIVKFDKQQTRNVLEKEQHRQTLFGQLGIL